MGEWLEEIGESFSGEGTGDLGGILSHFHLERRMNENFPVHFPQLWLLSSVWYRRLAACARCHSGAGEEVLFSIRREHSSLPVSSLFE